MAMQAHRVSQPNISVLQNDFGRTAFKGGNGEIGTDRFTLDDFSKLTNQPQQIRIIITPEKIIETVEGLRQIAEERADHSMGFHQLPLDENDINFGKKADQLAYYLSKTRFHALDPDKVIEAFSVVETYSLITILEEIAKKKGSYFGFKDTRTERDKEIADRASKLVAELKQNQYEETAIEAMKFIQLTSEEEIEQGSKASRPRRGIINSDEIFSLN